MSDAPLDPFAEELRRGRRWNPAEVPPDSQRAALYRLAAALRRANEALVNSDAGVDDINKAAQLAEELTAFLEQGPHGRALWGFAEASNAGDASASFDNSPVVGPANPVAPPVMLHSTGDGVEGTATFGQQYEGPPGHVHGGIVAAAFDEVLGMVQSLTGHPGMTARLVVNYRSPTPLHRELRFKARVDRVEGRKIFTSGTLHSGDRLCAEAEGLFVSVDFSRLRDIAAQDD